MWAKIRFFFNIRYRRKEKQTIKRVNTFKKKGVKMEVKKEVTKEVKHFVLDNSSLYCPF